MDITHTEKTMDELPEALAEMVRSFVAVSGVDFSDADAVRGRCEDFSRALAEHIDGTRIDEYETAESYRVQVWMEQVPEALAANDLAGGHYVTLVRWDGLEYEVDMTAAQFPELGWNGPSGRAQSEGETRWKPWKPRKPTPA
jgi:hypothetical protein